jgi:hypothetical protein
MPIPTDASLSTLRARFDRAVTKAEKISSESEAPELDSVRKQREAFEKLVSTTPQMEVFREKFGVEWNERFTPVSTFSRQAFFGYEGKALVEHLWRQLPNSRFKRFQEAFCDPADYAIPKPNLQAPCVAYPSRDVLNTCSLAGCLVSPTRVPFKLLVDLGIVTEPDRKLTDLEALAIKSDPRVIQTLKAVWASTDPLARSNNRFAIVRPLRDDTSRYYPQARDLSNGVVGSLIYTRENVAIDRSSARNARGSWTAPQIIPAFFSSIYAARRKTEHQNSSYQLETTTMGNLAVEWNELTTRAREEWRRNAPQEIKQEIRDNLVRLVARTREELSSVNHHLKQRAAERFEALEERLKHGSNNITTHITAANAAVTDLEKRLVRVPYKSGHNTVDCEQLSRMMQDGEHALELIRNSLFAAGSHLRDEMTRRDGFFSQRGLSQEQQTTQANIIISRMKIPVAALNNVPAVRPLRAFEIAHRTACTHLRNAILTQNAQAASEAMVKLVIFSKIQRANAIFEMLRSLTGRSEAVPLKELRRHATALRALLEARSAFPYTTVPEFQAVYRKLQRTVSTITYGLERYEQQGLDLDERTQMYSRLRAYLDKTDLEAYTYELLAKDEESE